MQHIFCFLLFRSHLCQKIRQKVWISEIVNNYFRNLKNKNKNRNLMNLTDSMVNTCFKYTFWLSFRGRSAGFFRNYIFWHTVSGRIRPTGHKRVKGMIRDVV